MLGVRISIHGSILISVNIKSSISFMVPWIIPTSPLTTCSNLSIITGFAFSNLHTAPDICKTSESKGRILMSPSCISSIIPCISTNWPLYLLSIATSFWSRISNNSLKLTINGSGSGIGLDSPQPAEIIIIKIAIKCIFLSKIDKSLCLRNPKAIEIKSAPL